MNKFDFVNNLGGVYTDARRQYLTNTLSQFNFTKTELQSLRKSTLQEMARLAIPWSSWMYQNKSEIINNLMRLQDC